MGVVEMGMVILSDDVDQLLDALSTNKWLSEAKRRGLQEYDVLVGEDKTKATFHATLISPDAIEEFTSGFDKNVRQPLKKKKLASMDELVVKRSLHMLRFEGESSNKLGGKSLSSDAFPRSTRGNRGTGKG